MDYQAHENSLYGNVDTTPAVPDSSVPSGQPPPVFYGPPPPKRAPTHTAEQAPVQQRPPPCMTAPQQPHPPAPTVIVTPQNNTSDHKRDEIKKHGAHICGILQISLGISGFILGIIEARAQIPVFGYVPMISAVLVIFAGCFGVQYGRTGGKCPCIASMVLSIISCLLSFSNTIVNIAFLSTVRLFNRMMSTHSLRSVDYYHWRVATEEAVYGLLIFVYLINFVVCIVQAGFACGLVCCRDENNRGYINSVIHHQPGNVNEGFGRF